MWQKLNLLLLIIPLSLVLGCRSNSSLSVSTPPLVTSECRVIQHAIGETCVPNNPQRIIVLDTNPLDAVLALGVKPIGAPNFFKNLQLPEAQTKEIEIIGGDAQPSLEKIALLKPDLILGIQGNTEIYPQLSQIAPTVIALENNAEWKEDLKLYAQALGKTEKAEQLLQDYHERIQDFQQRMGNRLQQTEVSIITTIAYGSNLPARIYLGDSFMGSVVQEAGLKRPTAQNTLPFALTQNWAIDVSIERLDLIDGDVIFAANTDPQNSELKSTLSALEQNPLWSNLNAVKQGRVYTVNYSVWVAQRNIGGANRILDDLFKYLVEENNLWK